MKRDRNTIKMNSLNIIEENQITEVYVKSTNQKRQTKKKFFFKYIIEKGKFKTLKKMEAKRNKK